MRKILFAIAICAIVTLSARAQVTFVITNSVTGVQYTGSVRPAGVNTLLTAWTTSGNFAPTSSGAVSGANCDPSNVSDLADCTANGVGIEGLDGSGNFLGYGILSYVSTNQINFEWRSTTATDATQVTQWKYMKDSGGGSFIVFGASNPSSQTVERFNLQPYLTSATIGGVTGQYLTGTLYGCTTNASPCPGYTALKSLTDGTANPRTYNSQPTMLQIYVTGMNGEDIANTNNQSYPMVGLRSSITDITNTTFYNSPGNGTQVLNAEWLNVVPTVWFGSGHQDLYVAYVGTTGGGFSYRQGPWNSSGDRPHGLVYFQ